VSTFNGLPAHILLNHFVVVLAPLTAVLAIVCAGRMGKLDVVGPISID
jgi:hypothetical protein